MTVPAGHDRIIRSYTADSQAHTAHSNTSNSDRGSKVGMLLPSNKARKLPSGILHVMTNQTVSLLTIC